MRKKKSCPVRSRGSLKKVTSTDCSNPDNGLKDGEQPGTTTKSSEQFLVEVDRSNWLSDEHLDIAEIVLKDVKLSDGYKRHNLLENIHLQFRLPKVHDNCFRLGHFPLLSVDDFFLELYVLESHCSESEDSVDHVVVLAGTFDGPCESIFSLIHLVAQKFVSVRPIMEDGDLTKLQTFRVRVEILASAFDACESLLEIQRQPWRKSMMNVMSWLRPEVTTSEVKYGINQLDVDDVGKCPETSDGSGSTISFGFDVGQFYESIKPSKGAPMLDNMPPDLIPQLRPYQRRAAYWMVQRENGFSGTSEEIAVFSPLCVPVIFLDRNSKMFYNPFCGSVSLHVEPSSLQISGGILADEMGLGKTVELLACIFSHCMPPLDASNFYTKKKDMEFGIKRVKRERVECICGSVTECYKYKGVWVQCDICDAWQHADCVGFSPKKKRRSCKNYETENVPEKDISRQMKKVKKRSFDITETHEVYICFLCAEMIDASSSTITSSATLIVCPSSILTQWYSEIMRHTRPGSLKVSIYEGAKGLDPSTSLIDDMTKLASSDIVLTTYDVLKEDLSHDSDRHDGDRRCMRFQKRYPVVPTLLTRIYWWRLCLDEAQMVESNTASVTEMALRLRAQNHWCITGTPIQRKLDDIYGLLRFLSAKPFDDYKWWTVVIKDPYERQDMVAMEFAHNFFKKIMWRSSKAHVSEELELPSQEECIVWLSFSPIEEHFYRKQHETCIGYAHEAIKHFKDLYIKGNISSSEAFLSHSEASKLLNPLLKLRQACCHPQVGASSGLRSLQQSPMTMEEILDVLISKTKIEGEEAMRKIIIALNGMAAISIIEQNFGHAISLYKEALKTAAENSDNFRIDPLLNLHIHHNMADVLPFASGHLQSSSCPKLCTENSGENTFEGLNCKSEDFDAKEDKKDTEHGTYQQAPPEPPSDGYLRKKCEYIKEKYLSGFISKLSLAQQEFRNSYSQVCHRLTEFKEKHEGWWLQSLDNIKQNKDHVEGLRKKIEQTFSEVMANTGSSRISSRFQNISSLNYTLQTSLDALEISRQTLLERLVEIDQTMCMPKEEDIERVRACPICQSGDGPLCVHCELDELFQLYETRLFRLKKGNSLITSADEAIDSQKKKKGLNLYFRVSKKISDTSDQTNMGQRCASTNVVVSRSPSDVEVILGVIKSYSKSKLGTDGATSAAKHIQLLEAMRKEFTHARSLSKAQAQVLFSYDEIKMSTSRLRLKETESEPTATNILTKDELIPFNMQFSSDKFMALSSLARISGQLRYLKGLALSKQEGHVCDTPHNQTDINDSNEKKVNLEPCPICHEKLGDKKMVFPCGHVTCCKCFLELVEQAGRSRQKWVMCPTCRQHTNSENVAYVHDRKSDVCDMMDSNSFHGQELSEMAIKIKGSYGTKVEAVTRRILWINFIDKEAKVLVFSSWNDVLDVLEHAFRANFITFVRMKGGRKSNKAISQFKECSTNAKNENGNSKSIQVLLLLIQHGANGLNLLEAQHVILVEPLLNPGTEAQAISRVHRVGQEKKTFVHRFFVKNTVEESVHKLNRSRTVNSEISVNSKHRDQPRLTLNDIEILYSPIAPVESTEGDVQAENLMHLPASVAAGIASERRLMEHIS